MKNMFKDNPVARGVAYAALQTVFGVLMAASVKLTAEEGHHFIEAMFYRSLFGIFAIFLILYIQNNIHRIFEASLKRQLARSLTGVVIMFFTFAAFVYLPLSEIQSLLFTAPLFVVVMSYPLLGEKVGKFRTIATIAGFSGILLIIQPGGISSVIGGIFGLCAAIGHATINIILRYLGRSELPYVTILYFSVVSTLVLLPVYPFYASWPSFYTGFLFVLIGLLGAGLQICLTKSFFLAPAAVIAPISYISLLWTLLLDFFIWSYIPGWPVIVGALIIIAANFTIVYREAKKKRREQKPGGISL